MTQIILDQLKGEICVVVLRSFCRLLSLEAGYLWLSANLIEDLAVVFLDTQSYAVRKLTLSFDFRLYRKGV